MISGTRLGRYEIQKKIGAGGMGEVFLAHDAQLDRNVALKVLLPEFCCDDERVHRFKLEAKAASGLNHPNIITIYEIDELDDRLFIATEFVNGETLREKIDRGELTISESIKIAEQVADALAVAHEAHIIHRDIKPENIMLRRDGYVKILDFGLAKPTALHPTSNAEDATLQLMKTQPGIVMGSVRYMSPEQARGRETDERTDVWSLGVVLYEMLNGKNPFEGETISDSLAALIHVEPPRIEGVPEEMHRILRKALKKNASERYQSIKDFALDLKDLRSQIEQHLSDSQTRSFSKTISFEGEDTGENKTLLIHQTSPDGNTTGGRKNKWSKTQANTASNSISRRFLPLAALAVFAVLVFGAWYLLPAFLGTSEPKFQSIQVSRLTDNGTAHLAAISPDGKLVVFQNTKDGKQSLLVRQVATGSAVEIVPPTSSGFYQPTFSPDGEFVYYVSEEKGIGTLFRVSTLGGESKKISYDVDSRITFSPDGKRFAFIRHNPAVGGDTIFIADSDGSNLQPFVETKAVGYDQFTGVAWSPDNERLLLGVFKGANEQNQKMRFATVDLEDKAVNVIGENGWYSVKSFEWAKDNLGVLFVGKKNVGESMQIWYLSYPNAESRQITTDTNDYASLSVSANTNSIVATKVDVISSFWTYLPATKELKQLTPESKTLFANTGASQMPDGKILFSRKIGEEINVFSMNEDGSGERQLTSGSEFNLEPIATPDSKYIVFVSNRKGNYSVWRMNADKTNPVQLTNTENVMDGQIQIANEGKTVIFMRQKTDGSRASLMKVSIDGGDAQPLFPESQFSELGPKISPDGKRLAYYSFLYDNQTSDMKRSVKVVGMNGEKVEDSAEKIELNISPEFKWSSDSKFLTYIDRSGVDNLWSVSIADKKEKPLTDFNSSNITNFTWSRDGKKIFIQRGLVNGDLVLIKDGGNSRLS
jgi:serine/threonine protein kinase/dipeptidyl aminopeptidase/acylaminoacyl peptidase